MVDRFGDVLVVQLASAAMELRKDEVLAALLQVLKPAAVLWKNDSSARDAEGLGATWPMPTAKCRSGSPWKRTA